MPVFVTFVRTLPQQDSSSPAAPTGTEAAAASSTDPVLARTA